MTNRSHDFGATVLLLGVAKPNLLVSPDLPRRPPFWYHDFLLRHASVKPTAIAAVAVPIPHPTPHLPNTPRRLKTQPKQVTGFE